MQLGSWNEEAAAIGEAAGLNVVMDKCVKIEHARFHGGLHLAGFQHRRDFCEASGAVEVSSLCC